MPVFPEEKIIVNQTKATLPADVRPFVDTPLTEVYTLIARPTQAIRDEVSRLSEALRSKDSGHYFYTPAQYHFTIMGDIQLSHEKEELMLALEESLSRHPLVATYKGLQINNRSAYVAVYFQNDSLHALRSEIRKQYPASHDYSTFLEGLDSIAWLNVVRFSGPFSDSLKAFALSQADQVLGIDEKPQIEFYSTTSLVLSSGNSQLLRRFG